MQIGCVSLSQRFFGDGRLSAKRIERARLAARLELEPIKAVFLRRGWNRAFGSSGTIRAIADSIRELDPASTGITPAGNELLLQRLAKVGHMRELDLDAVTDERLPVFPGGVVIMTEIIDALGIQQLRFVEGALRDGLLYDMVGRMTRSDARERTVSSMQRRYHVDLEQAGRVEGTALQFLSQVSTPWELADPLAELSLKWAARLHEIGLDVAHSGYHRHGAYLLENADMPGFAREEQQLLARLVGSHRRKLRCRTGRSHSAMGPAGAASDRAAAPGGAAAPGPERRAAAEHRTHRAPWDTGAALSAALAQRAPADGGRSAAGD